MARQTGQDLFKRDRQQIIKLFVRRRAPLGAHCEPAALRETPKHEGRDAAEILWEIADRQKQVLITSRRLVSFANKHRRPQFSKCDGFNARPPYDLFRRWLAEQQRPHGRETIRGKRQDFAGRLLHPRASMPRTVDRVVTRDEKSRCQWRVCRRPYPETVCRHGYKACHTADFVPGRLHVEAEARPSDPPHNAWSITRRRRLRPRKLRACRTWTWIASMSQGVQQLLAGTEQKWPISGTAATVQVRISGRSHESAAPWRSSSIRFNLFTHPKASARGKTRVSAKGSRDRPMRELFRGTAKDLPVPS